MKILDILHSLTDTLAKFGNVEAKIAVSINNPERKEIVGILPMTLQDRGEAFITFLAPTYDAGGNLVLDGPFGPTGPIGQMPEAPVVGDSKGYQDTLIWKNPEAFKESAEAEANVNISVGLAAVQHLENATEIFYTDANPGDFPKGDKPYKQSSFTFYRDKDKCVNQATVGRTVYECQIKPLVNVVKATEPFA